MHTIHEIPGFAVGTGPLRWPLKVATALLMLSSLLLVPAAQAVHPLVVLEDSYELLPAEVRWPDTANGAVLLPGCARCKQDRYVLGASARFLVGSQAVSYRQFLVAARSARASAVFIAIERSTGEVSRATVMP